MATPKTAWSRKDLLGAFTRRFAVPVSIETDVTAAAMAELVLGAGRDVKSLAYITAGTGIGGGFAPVPWNGARLLHPEMGHLRVERHPHDLSFPGVCPFHGDCLEGLASGPAVQARWARQLCELADDHPAWQIIGSYLGQLVLSITLVASPQRVVFGGGLASDGRLLPHIRSAARGLLNGYLEPLSADGALERYLCMPALADGAGLTGAFLLAEQARDGRVRRA
jgi:fructokinase